MESTEVWRGVCQCMQEKGIGQEIWLLVVLKRGLGDCTGLNKGVGRRGSGPSVLNMPRQPCKWERDCAVHRALAGPTPAMARERLLPHSARGMVAESVPPVAHTGSHCCCWRRRMLLGPAGQRLVGSSNG